MSGGPLRTITWDSSDVLVLDQTLLPDRKEFVRLHTVAALAEAITSLRVRGAMGLGVVGGLGVALAIRRAQESGADPVQAARDAGRVLAATRPTATNLSWGIGQVLRALASGPEAAVDAAVALLDADVATNQAIAEAGATFVCDELVERGDNSVVVMTHCNAGALAGVEVGTALGILAELHRRGRVREAIVCETRPLLQGARLTCWELREMEIPCSLIVDSAAAGLITGGEVGVIIVGADRIAANGDVANKVGTLAHALAAHYAGVPLVVAAPEATIDPDCPTGLAIPIEQRSEREVTTFAGVSIAPAEVRARNAAFDVTPAELVTAIVTEQRVIKTAAGQRAATDEVLTR